MEDEKYEPKKKQHLSPNKRTAIKLGIVGIIVMTTIAGITMGIPTLMGIPTAEKAFEGFPTYACDVPNDITSCNNKTAIQGYVWTDNGRQVLDVNFKFDEP